MAAAPTQVTQATPLEVTPLEVTPALWYGALLGGLVPILLAGFLASAVADRIVFAGWGLGLGAAWAVLLRQGLAAGWPRRALWGALALVLGAGLAAFGWLLARHGDALDLGLRATLPVGAVTPGRAGTDRLLVARPAAVLVPAAVLLAGGGLLLAGGRAR